jgi:hypothetical protein
MNGEKRTYQYPCEVFTFLDGCRSGLFRRPFLLTGGLEIFSAMMVRLDVI